MEASDLNFSLDAYIRKRQGPICDRFISLDKRKNKPEISEESLTKSLDEYIKARSLTTPGKMVSGGHTAKGCGKFDRKSLQDFSDTEDEDEPKDSRLGLNDSDVDMKDTIKEEQLEVEETDDISDLPRFQTIESLNRIRVRSQNFRLLAENIVDRPEGVTRLEFLPLEEYRRLNLIRSGRVNKRKRYRRDNSFSGSENTISGSFVEKGSFTYKFGSRNAGSEQEIIGIERAKTVTPSPAAQEPQVAPAASVTNINFFLDGSTTPETISDALAGFPNVTPNARSCAALNALKVLQKKRDQQKYNMTIQKEMATIQDRPLVFEDNGSETPKVITTDGGGIHNLNIQPHTTAMPFGIRFA